MKIRLPIINKLGKIQTVLALRSSLKNYLKFQRQKGKIIWVRKELYEKFRKKVLAKSKQKLFGYRIVEKRGRTQLFGKRFVRYKFAMWRFDISDISRIPLLMQRLKKRYKSVEKYSKQLPTQRIGLTVAAARKEFDEFTNYRTKRKNKREVLDFMSTGTYARNEPSTPPMFEELEDKLLEYLGHKSKSPSLLDEENDKRIKDFFVFFTEE